MLGLGLGLPKITAVTDYAKKLLNLYNERVISDGGYIEGSECALAKMKELSKI
jgi:hypothetical protein